MFYGGEQPTADDTTDNITKNIIRSKKVSLYSPDLSNEILLIKIIWSALLQCITIRNNHDN